MKEYSKKAGYEAPKIEATGFMAENGYAASATPQPVKSFTLGVGKGGL